MMIFITISCNKAPQAPDVQDVVFHATTAADGFKASNCDNPTANFALIQIDDEIKQVDVFYLNNTIYTNTIKLSPGSHTLKMFVLVNDGGTPDHPDGDLIVNASPLEGYTFANFVEKPLPFDFEINAFYKTEIPIELLCYEAANHEDFGFTWFSIEEIVIREFCFFGDICINDYMTYAGSQYENQRNSLQHDMPAIFQIDVIRNGTLLISYDNADWLGEGRPLCVQYPDYSNFTDNYKFVLSVLLKDGDEFKFIETYTWETTDDGQLPNIGEDNVLDFVLGDCVPDADLVIPWDVENIDTDGDGIVDIDDLCANTPFGETVNAQGCSSSQIDTDGDGIMDDVDACIDTYGVATDNPLTNGCPYTPPTDTDGDGVADDDDLCANTPSGETVNAQGCSSSQIDTDGDGIMDDVDACIDTYGVATDNPLTNGCPYTPPTDTDGDGVADDDDLCANTPNGVQVDVNGCPIDSDNDGVADYLDLCADTPTGTQVDANGCPIDANTGFGDETAFAYGGANAICFLEDPDAPDNSRWGWTNGTYSESNTMHTLELWAGAADCDQTKGYYVGTVTLKYVRGDAKVTYNINEGVTLKAVHLYVGNEKYPLNGTTSTVAPGKFTFIDDDASNGIVTSIKISGLSGDIYIIAHADVYGN